MCHGGNASVQFGKSAKVKGHHLLNMFKQFILLTSL